MTKNNIVIYAEANVRSCVEMTSGMNVIPAIDFLRIALSYLLSENLEEQWVLSSIRRVNMLCSACKLLAHPSVDESTFGRIVAALSTNAIDYNKLDELVSLGQAKIRANSVK